MKAFVNVFSVGWQGWDQFLNPSGFSLWQCHQRAEYKYDRSDHQKL